MIMADNNYVRIMGIMNVTPDSFYAGSRFQSEYDILHRAEKMLEEGADIIDIGGVSTRPGSEYVSENEEYQRVIPAIKILRQTFGDDIVMSLDTFRPWIAKAGCDEGCAIINDISGGCEEMYEVAAKYDVNYILMHFIGEEGKMEENHVYHDMMKEIMEYFNERISLLKSCGVEKIIIDPGFGFSKTVEENHYLLDNLSDLKALGYPILVGLSRKSMLYKPLGITPEEALEATIQANLTAVQNGADILRVHDVAEHRKAITLLSQEKTR